MNTKLGLGRVAQVSIILLIVVIVAVVGATYMVGFLTRPPPTTSSSTQTVTTGSIHLTTITSIKTSTITTSSVTLKLPETRSYMANIFDLFGNFSLMSVSITNTTDTSAVNFTSTETLTYSVANLTSTAASRTAAVGFDYNYTSVQNRIRETFSNVSIAIMQLTRTDSILNFSLVDSNGTIYFGEAAQVVGNELIAPFYYIMGVGLPVESSQYTSSQSGLAQQSFANFNLPETTYSIEFSDGASATATVGDYPPASLLLVSYATDKGWSYHLTAASSG